MTISSAQELLAKHDIAYVATKKSNYTTNCPHCSGGYLNVQIERDRVVWFCHHCQEGGGEDYEQREEAGDLGPIVATFDYTDEAGERLFQALRFEPPGRPKQFRQRTGPDQKKWSIKGVRIVPFRLPELIADIASERVVFVVEGEKDVNTLRSRGVPATCNPMGAGKWWPEFNDIVRGADVVICGDNDQPGRDHVKLVAKNLHGVASRLRVLDLKTVWPEIEESDDVSDWFAAGGTVEQLWEFVEQLEEWRPSSNGADNGKDAGNSSAPQSDESRPLPWLDMSSWDDGAPPPIEWSITNIVPREQVGLSSGVGGTGKTTCELLKDVAHVPACRGSIGCQRKGR